MFTVKDVIMIFYLFISKDSEVIIIFLEEGVYDINK